MITMSKIKEKDFRNICCFVSEFNKKAEQNGEVNLTPRETDSEYIEINGEINVYSQHLAALFFSIKPLQVQNSITFEIFEINPKDLLAIYTEGYKEGVKQFRDEYRLTMKDLTTIDTENHIEALKASYFHNGGWMSLNGWISAKSTVFSSFTLERLKEFGKESGLLSEADKYIKLNPTIFKDFHTTPPKHSEQKKTQTKNEATNSTFTALQWSAIFYYVQPDLYGEIQTKKEKLTRFIKDFNVKVSNNGLLEKISHNNLSNKLNEIERVFNGDEKNELKQKHINAIKAILPYLENNQSEAFENATDDLERLQDELDRE